MTPDRWRQVTEIFHATLARPSDQRDAFLLDACRDDSSLRHDVEFLLAGHQQADGFGGPAALDAHARLSPGATLGSYRIQRLIDAGGMGEVYQATDTKLGREVAIKVLPAEVAADPNRLARFTREAQLLAALNHPHIAAIYGVEDAGDVHALVLELVDGETLAKSLARSKPPIVEALRIAQQIADAMAFAHARGIIHRDLKPSNVMITSVGAVKVLDFGLAKVSERIVADQRRTQAAGGTQEGIVVGTPRYMSPEQARGKPVDKQTDIWAFGCVLFEALSGSPPFRGDTASDTIAAVLDRDPDWSLLPAQVPASIQTLVRRCLKKEAAERLHDIADARLEIADALSAPGEIVAPAANRRPVWPVVAGLVSLALLGVTGWAWLRAERSQSATGLLEFSINLSDITPGYGFEVSPDGRRIAIGGLSAGRAHIWLQALDGSESAPVVAGDVGVAPFWSPDGGSIAYLSGGKLWRLDLARGPAIAICDAAGRGSGSWSQDGQIVFSAAGQLFRVPAGGGGPQPVVVADQSSAQSLRIWPQFLPDARHFIYHVRSSTEEAEYVGSLDSPSVSRLFDSPSPAKYVAPGYLLFLRGTALMARALDTRSLALTAEAFVVARDAAPGYIGGVPAFSASKNGVLAFVPTRAGTVGQLAWFDRNGRVTGHIEPPTRVEYLNPAISATGDRVAVNRMDPESGNWDIWTLDVDRNLPTRQTSDESIDADPVWAPDGKSIVFTSNRGHTLGLYRKSLDSSAAEERVVSVDSSTSNVMATDWSRDGRFLIYETQDQLRRTSEIWALPLAGTRTAMSLVRNGFYNYGAHLSPDGQWLAYSSSQDGAFAVYVQRFVGGGDRTRVTSGGGVHPHWTDDGKTIVFWAEPGGLSSVDLTFGPSGPRAGQPQPIVSERIATLLDGRTHFDVTRDGRRFLLRQSVGQPRPTVKVLVNWTAKLKS